MPRRRTSSLPIHGTSAVPCQQPASVPSSADHPLLPQQHSKSTPLVSAAWKPPRKEEGQLDNDAIDDPRGGPLKLDDLQLNVLAKTDAFLVLNKNPDVRLDGDFNVTIEKAMHRDYPEIAKFRWIHQLDFATSGVMCVGLTKEYARLHLGRGECSHAIVHDTLQ
ncbi:hypothetical protein AaE_006534, partial [Aphanomyces astaci]